MRYSAGKAIAHLAQVSNTTGILIYACFIIIFAAIGYRLIHWVGKVASVALLHKPICKGFSAI